MDHGARWSRILVSGLTTEHGLGHTHVWVNVQVGRWLGHHRFGSVFELWLRGIIWSPVSIVAETLLFVFGQLSVRINLFTSLRALEPQMLE